MAAVEAVTLRVTVRAPSPSLEQPQIGPAHGPAPTRPVEVVADGVACTAGLVRRGDLRSGHMIEGPAVIHEYSGTTWVPPGCTATVDAWACLHLAFGP
jgi:N-methylhydantoinase A